MYRHDLDPIALVLGALFTIVGLAYAIGRWTWFDINGGWALALLLLAFGFAGVLSGSLRARDRARGRGRAQSLGGPMVEASEPKLST